MWSNYISSQEILNRVFVNRTGSLRAGTANAGQDILNSVYDEKSDSLRMTIAGGMLPAVTSEAELPSIADPGQICPVTGGDGSLEFYQYDGASWSKVSAAGQELTPDQSIAMEWLSENLDNVKAAASFDYAVRMEEIVLPHDVNSDVVVQGESQPLLDNEDKDGDIGTTVRIDVKGYVLGVETYADSSSTSTDRYYTKLVYEPNGGSSGTSHIYMEADEYNWFSSLPDGKNILRVFYLANAFPSSLGLQELVLELPDDNVTPVSIDQYGNISSIVDGGDTDGDPLTHYRLDIPGYLLDMEGWYSEDAVSRQRFMCKTTYDRLDNVTYVYMTSDEYEAVSRLGNGKNKVSAFTLKGSGMPLPSGGRPGQVLVRTEGGCKWADLSSLAQQ